MKQTAKIDSSSSAFLLGVAWGGAWGPLTGALIGFAWVMAR
jgi:hypothetical protein